MNKKILSIGFIFVFISLFFSGCEEVEEVIGPGTESQNYIVVTVNAEICIINDTHQTPVESQQVYIEIVKAGGERFEGEPITGSDGCTTAHASFNLYKEQPIVATAYPYSYSAMYQQKTLPWEVVKSQANDNAYTWNVYFAFVL